MLPVRVILFVLVYVLNISRLFLSGHGHIPVIVGTIITTIILLGSTLLGTLHLTDSGSTVKGTAYFANPCKYTFYCSIPGHRPAGMTGTLTVTGPPVPTLQAALTAAGDTEADLKAAG